MAKVETFGYNRSVGHLSSQPSFPYTSIIGWGAFFFGLEISDGARGGRLRTIQRLSEVLALLRIYWT